MKGIWIILGIVLVVVIIAGAVIFTTSNNSGTGKFQLWGLAEA